jgi:hypothetical protein
MAGLLDDGVARYSLDASRTQSRRVCPRQAAGETRIAATVMAKSVVGQERKPHMLWALLTSHLRLHMQCSIRVVCAREEDEGGENRESNFSLAQALAAINQELVQRTFTPYFWVMGGTMPFIRKYSTICP